jgi:2-methylcitrate dehydratase PrpD
MVNAEAMNLLDADDTFLDIAHFGALITAVALAEAQRTGADWTTLRHAVARGFDINARLSIATRARPGLIAPGLMMLGATIAASCAAGGNPDHEASAIALAMRTAPAPTTRAVSLAEPGTFKYAPYAALASGAIQAARCAHAGYVSAAAPVFFETQCVDLASQRLAEAGHWWVERTALKPWPSFRLGHPVLDAVEELVRRYQLTAAGIDSIHVRLDPRALALPFHRWPEPRTFDDMLLPLATAMNLRLSVALLVTGIPPGPSWARRATLRLAEVRRLMNRVVISDQPAIAADRFEAMRDADTGLVPSSFGSVRIEAGGKVYEEDREGADGDRADWGWLRRKAGTFLGNSEIVDHLANLSPNSPAIALTH